jgi:hypothetical protein
MEITQRGPRPQPTNNFVANQPTPPNPHQEGGRSGKSKKKLNFLSMRTGSMILLLGILAILIVIIAYLSFGNFFNEGSYVNKSQYQAVFVNINGSSGGQAYFGNITAINSKNIVLSNVFYLQSGSSSNQFTLNNLSCALYNPQDQMIINRDQVAFWENLKSNSQVTQDINKWNSEKLQCATPSSNSSSSTSSTTGTTGTGTSSTTGTSTKP